MNKLELRDITCVYGEGTPFRMEALRHVNVGFEEGKITGIIGHTGSGKSTLVQLLNGLIKPDEGTVLLDGKDIWEKPKEIRNVRFRVGLVMQYPEYQLFDETVRADIGFALRNRGCGSDEIDCAVRDALRFVGLDESYLNISPFDLSGGQKRRVALAGILVMKPEVLVLDEPAAGLDPRGRREILGGLSRYRDEQHATVILVSHSMEDMAQYCEQVVVMKNGSADFSGTVEEVFSDTERLLDVGLDIPQVSRIAEELRRRGFPLKGKLYTVKGVRDALLAYQRGEGENA